MHRFRSPAPLLFLALLLLSAAPAGAAAPALGPGNRDFDQLHLALRVEPDLRAGTVKGEARLTFASLVDGLRTLRLDCLDTTVLSVLGPDGNPMAFSIADGVLSIELPAPLAMKAESTVAIRYYSRPTRGLYFHAPTKRYPFVPLSCYSQGEGTDNRHWIPCYDEPDDRLTLEMTAVIPDGLTSVGNGVRTETKDLPGPKKEESWRMDARLPTYLITLAVGPYRVFSEKKQGVTVEYYAFPGQLDDAKVTFGATPEMIAFFGDWLGVPYPFPRYAQVFVWDFLYGGMENTTATTMNLRLLHGAETDPIETAEGVVAHELAHQWFGDYLTCRTFAHMWLNEGFATYLADLWTEHSRGEAEFEVARYRQTRSYLEGTPSPEKLGLTRDDRGDQPLELFGGKQYDRGAAILHMLRLELGDDIFRKGLGRYVRENADRAVTTENLRRAMEEEAGRDLSWFFDEWVYGAGYPVLSIRVKRGEKAVRLTVEQRQVEGGGQGTFRLTLPVRIETTDGSFPARLPIRDRRQEFDVPVTGDLLHVCADDGAWLLGRAEVEQGRAAFAHQARTDPDPVGRIVALDELLRFGGFGTGVIAEVLRGDEFYAVRQAAAEALGKRSDSEVARTALLAAVSDPDARVRRTVFDALGGFDREHAAGAVAKAVKEEPNPYVRAAAAHALGRLHAEGCFEALLPLLGIDSHREVIRQGAIEGLLALGDPRAVAEVTPLLDYRYDLGAQSRMRHSALDLVLKLAPDARATRATVIGLLDDPYFRMRAWAAGACGTWGFASALPRLRKMAADDPDGGARRAAARAVKKLEK